MKVNTQVSSISKSYSEKKFEIDFNDEISLGKLFQSLIMIYKDKFSFVREFVQNAYDAVVEVWETNYENSISLDEFLIKNPILVSLYKDSKGNYFEVKETKGIGISPERMDNMFRFLTKSTKQNSINQIGAKGIGKMAALSYTEEYFISTVYNSILYEYKISWYNQQGIPTISEPVISKTKEHSGTTIRVYLKTEEDTSKILSSVKNFLSYFNNIYYSNIYLTNKYYTDYFYDRNGGVYVNNLTVTNSLNDCTLHNYKTFLYRETIDIFDKKAFLIVDRIPYEIDWNLINMNVIYLPFGIKVSSSEILLNDNRDSIRYTDSVIQIIREKIINFKKELLDFIQQGFTTNNDDLSAIWRNNTKLMINKVSFTLSSNPLAYWKSSQKYVESIDFSLKSTPLLNHLFNPVLIAIKDKNIIRTSLPSYNSLLNSSYGKFEDVSKNHYLVLKDIDVKLNSIGLSNLDIYSNIVVVDKPDLDVIKKEDIGVTNDNNLIQIKKEINYYFNNKVFKLSKIYNEKRKPKAITKKNNESFKISTLTSQVNYYNYNVSKIDRYITYPELTDKYIIFNTNENDSAKNLNAILSKFGILNEVSLVAPTFCKKIKYNLQYFLNTSKEFELLRIAFLCYKLYEEKNSYFFPIIYDAPSITSKKLFKDTIVLTIIEEILSDRGKFFIYLNIFMYSTYIVNMVKSFEDNYKDLLDTSIVNSNVYSKFKELLNIFNNTHKELKAINYRENNTLINETVKIILNKNKNV
ncbi:MAG TPA: ATP-binding protein [Burkholderiales bacterium]|nr:ATP-binding protein [Burkholderiales bacterium]